MKNIFNFLVTIFLFHSYAQAGFLFEPYVGYQTMVTDIKTGSASGSLPVKLDGAGIGFGMRLGFSGLLLFAGLDYGVASLNMKLKEGALPITPGASLHSSMGGTIVLNLPIIRPHVGYLFDDRLQGTDSSLIGSGTKVGLGFGVIPKLKINIEYYTITFNKYKSSTEVSLPDANTYELASMTGMMLNLSATY